MSTYTHTFNVWTSVWNRSCGAYYSVLHRVLPLRRWTAELVRLPAHKVCAPYAIYQRMGQNSTLADTCSLVFCWLWWRCLATGITRCGIPMQKNYIKRIMPIILTDIFLNFKLKNVMMLVQKEWKGIFDILCIYSWMYLCTIHKCMTT